ncbi:MAG: MBL fold metallo-hydrolase [Sulfolobaceae archaeon]
MSYIKILGGGREVGRSAIFVGDTSEGIVLDYGVNFSKADEPNLPLQIEPRRIKSFIVSHAHLDHIGALPLYQISNNIQIVGTSISRTLSEIMLKDFLKLSGPKLPFEWVELRRTMENFKVIEYNEEVDIGNSKVKLVNAGHIPGSAITLISHGNNEIAYTGDINTIETYLSPPADISSLKDVDTLIIEATYGKYNHPDRKRVEEEFYNAILEVIEGGGTVLVPAFSLARSQEILALLADRDFPYPVYYDGMVREITEVFLKYPQFVNKAEVLKKVWDKFGFIENWEMRKKVWKERCVIVASAGMLKGGPALFYLKKLYDNEKNAVFLVSYQAENTPGRKLLESGKIDQNSGLLKARFQIFDFSSHAGKNQLLGIIKSIRNLQRVIIVHSSPETAYNFANIVRQEMGIKEVIVPENGQEIIL